jgi:hypothetical protein
VWWRSYWGVYAVTSVAFCSLAPRPCREHRVVERQPFFTTIAGLAVGLAGFAQLSAGYGKTLGMGPDQSLAGQDHCPTRVCFDGEGPDIQHMTVSQKLSEPQVHPVGGYLGLEPEFRATLGLGTLW